MDKTPIPGGLLVAIEGIDGAAGKSTLARSLAASLHARGVACVLSKEPTAGPWGQQLRASAATERLGVERELELLMLDRQEHVAQLAAHALARHEVVILDRYYFSNISYQGAEGLASADIQQRNEAFAPVPDLLLLLDAEPAVGLARIATRGDVANAFETTENLERCRAIFLATPAPSRVVIDARQSADAVFAMAELALLAAGAKIKAGLGESVAGGNAVLEFFGSEPICV